ncbi:ABC transporter ATP-binding protein [Rhodobacter sp. KR11]|uniref:ABC transporter ATP-binding protein n=1 Tax=Rhodobacter sp. KR11 TaxID=2974588 RepID=UPI00222303D2|nr:ABC transporter ATP-binding protein [Rhodobacter sp. KR11]MCW1920733.1 ABC transporter ATP-binding protein [Rhodobacter sp. KR11]
MTDLQNITGGEQAPVLTVQHLTVSVRTEGGLRPLVQDLSFTLNRGETLAIAGESGSGKSITSLAIMGLLPPPAVRITGGRIALGATDLAALPEAQMRKIRGDRVAMIFQEPMTSLNPVLTVGAQLTEAIRAHEPVSRAEAKARAIKALTAVRLSQPERRMTQFPHELSGGMRQRVMIAMALALRPEVLIADEPTTALDVTVQREVLDLLRDLQREMGTAIILITHDMGVVAEMADRVIVMKAGRMVEEAPVARLFTAPKADYTQKLLAAVPRMGGPDRPAPMAAPVASLRDVVVRFPIRGGMLSRVVQNVHAVEHVSFDIPQGQTFALVGESGCGKSTIAKALVGLAPHQGQITVAGQTVTETMPRALRAQVQMVFQDPMAALDPRMTVGDLIAEPLVIHGLPHARDRAADLMARVGLSKDQLDRYPHEFSGGQRQRICIARALALNPRLVIADESVSALDVSVQAQVLRLLQQLQDEMGMAYLFISHDMAVVDTIASRVAVMHLGQIVEMGTRAQVFGNPQHPYTQRLIEAVPQPDPTARRPPLPRLAGEVPSPLHPPGQGPARLRLIDRGAGHLVAEA